MNQKVFSCGSVGLNCQIIEVEADISNGMPTFTIVGLGDTSVQESKERVRSSIKNSGATFPQTRKVINLAPAQIRKQGSLFDLPIALSILAASNQISADIFKDAVFIGELSLNGGIKPIKGALPITEYAKKQGFRRIFLPAANALEAAFIENIEIYPVNSLRELIDFGQAQKILEPLGEIAFEFPSSCDCTDFNQIEGLPKAKRALLIAASGGHNSILYGPPGFGKTILCRSLASLLPDMCKEEILETTKIYSISGLLDEEHPLVYKRPFREVHHTATLSAIVGGGLPVKAGEISFAHNGVLFFDEIAEFDKSVLEALRQPLEDKFIHLNRLNYSCCFPANFIFLASMNPCPCGKYDGGKNLCRCTESQIKNYQKKLSGPLLDRFDIFLEVPKSPFKNIFHAQKDFSDPTKQIKNASAIQRERFEKYPHIFKNADMTLNEIKKFCQMDKYTKDILSTATAKLELSNRGYLKTLKLARTIADMDSREKIDQAHILEALQYRPVT